MFEPVPKPEPAPPPSNRIIPSLAVLAGPERMAELKACCAEFSDLSGLSASEIVLRHGGGLVLVEQGVDGYDQVILTLAVERPNTAVIVVSDQRVWRDIKMLGIPRRSWWRRCLDSCD